MSSKSLAEQLMEATARCRAMDAPLPDRLQALADAVRSLSAEFADVVERMVHRLKASGAGTSAPAAGHPMPEFLLPDQDGGLLSLSRLLEEGPLVIAFHRGHWCPYCQINASALSEAFPEIQAQGGRVVAITPELEEYAWELKSDAETPYPILTDLDNAYALDLGLAIWVGEEKQRYMKAAGWDIAPYQGNQAWMLPIPATFVVGQDGIVVARFLDQDYRKRMAIEDILTALKLAARP